MDRRRTKSLEGKCGSCRFFTLETGEECVGYCSGRMNHKGRLNRTYKCIGYEEGENAKQPPTNADRIRGMTDEELAEWIISITEDLTPKWLKWLKQEATE